MTPASKAAGVFIFFVPPYKVLIIAQYALSKVKGGYDNETTNDRNTRPVEGL